MEIVFSQDMKVFTGIYIIENNTIIIGSDFIQIYGPCQVLLHFALR